MAFLAVFASVVAFGIQNVSLAYVPPSQASLFLSLESVFGVLFSVMLYGEQIGLRLVMGFALIFVAIVVSETFPLKRREPQGEDAPSTGDVVGIRRHLMAQESERSNIVLIGMPGAGKSTLGIVLAKILNYNFIDADLVIQNQCDKTLQKLIDACGPEGFIQVENQILSDLTAERSIIATGGSAVYSDEAMKHLSGIGRIVYLQISYDELKRRLHDLQERGVVLKGGIGMSLRELYDERKPLYERYAEVTVNVDDLSITAAARKVADALR